MGHRRAGLLSPLNACKRWLCLVSSSVLLISVGACGKRDPGSEGIGASVPLDYSQLAIETFASAITVQAGGWITIRCVVSQDRNVLEGVPTEIQWPTASGSLQPTGPNSFDYQPVQAGVHLIRCEAGSGALVDSTGVSITVTPAAPVVAETQLSPPSVSAGQPSTVKCAGFDTYGNSIEPLQNAFLRRPPAVTAVTTADGFEISATAAGDYPIACAVATDGDNAPEGLQEGQTDPTPELLSVVPGPPGASFTSVDRGVVEPTDTVRVSCLVTDLYGNAIEETPSRIIVLPEEPSSRRGSDTQASPPNIDGTSFTTTTAGNYYVFCTVPGMLAGDESPAQVTVKPGLPHSWVVDVPQQDCYWQGAEFPVTVAVMDPWGNRVERPELHVQSAPSEGLVWNPVTQTFSLDQEADYDLTISLLGPTAEDSTIEPYHSSIRVDSTPPRIELQSPHRAQAIVGGDYNTSTVLVTGRVTDNLSSIVAASLDQSPLETQQELLERNSSVLGFESEVDSRWGLTIIQASAQDACGNRRSAAQTFLRSPTYFEPATTPSNAAQADEAVVAHLSQAIMDDGDRRDVDDLGTLFDRILAAQDFNALILPGQVFTEDGRRGGCSTWDTWIDTWYTIQRNPDPNQRVVLAPRVRNFQATDGGMTFDVMVDQLHFPMRVSAGDWHCPLFGSSAFTVASIARDAAVSANWIHATGEVAIAQSGGQAQVQVRRISLNTSGLDFWVDCGVFQVLCDGAISLALNLLRETLENTLEGMLASQLPPLVEGFMQDFQLAQGFPLPPPISMQLNIASSLQSLQFQGPPGAGQGLIGLSAQVYPSARDPQLPSNAGGAIKRGGTPPPFTFSSNTTFGLALKDDLLNQVLWAMWYGGGLNLLDVASFAQTLGGDGSLGTSLGGFDISFFATSPPVIMPGTPREDGTTYAMDIGIGDAYIEAVLDLAQLLGSPVPSDRPFRIGMFVSTIMGGSLDLDPQTNQLIVDLETQPDIHIEVAHIDDMGYQAELSFFFTELVRLILPELLAQSLGAFPLPSFDVGGLAGVPTGVQWGLANGELQRAADSGYFVLSGSLATTPTPQP